MTEEEDFYNGFALVPRADGRIELMCKHGVGHTAMKLTAEHIAVSSSTGIHGCDGCCTSPRFEEAEGLFLKDFIDAKERRGGDAS